MDDNNLPTIPEEFKDLYVAKDYDTLLPLLDIHLTKEPDNVIARFYKGEIYFERKDFETARKEYDVVIIALPILYPAWQKLAMSYIRLHEYRSAIDTLNESLKYGGHDDWTWCLLGLAHYLNSDKENMELTLMALEGGLKHCENKYMLAYTKAYILDDRGDVDEAALAYVESETYAEKEGVPENARTANREGLYKMLNRGKNSN